jgi:hypothetical protein
MNQDLAGYSLFNALHVDGVKVDLALWVDADNARATADGSVGDPFATIQAAIDKFVADGITDDSPRVLMVYGGTYDEDLTFPSKGTFDMVCLGKVDVGTTVSERTISRTADSADQLPGKIPILRIYGTGFGNPDLISFALFGQFVLADATAGYQQIFSLHHGLANRTAGVNAVDATGQTLLLSLNITGSFLNGVNAPSATFKTFFSSYDALVTSDKIDHALACEFDDVTVATAVGAAPATLLQGFYDCIVAGDFTGPASSFVCDAVTWTNHKNGAGSLLGGATYVLVEEPPLHASSHDDGGDDELTVQSLGSAAATAGQRLTADGTGGWSLSSVIDCGTF